MTTKKKWRDLTAKGIKIMSDAADVAVHLRSNPGPIGWVAVGAKVFHAFNEATETKASDFFRGWTYLKVYPLGDFIFSLCVNGHLLVDEKSGSGDSNKQDGKNVTARIGNLTIGWTVHDSWKEGPFAPPGQDIDATIEVLKELVWQMMGNAVKFHVPALGHPSLLDDSIDETLPSKTAEELWSRQRKFLKAGYRRSMLVHGEPGTGKSNIIRYMTDKAGGRRLRLRARDLESLRSLGRLISFLEPSGVMIDDLDRAKNADGILEELDEIMAMAQLFLVTVNVVNKLDPATVRRFDDTAHIEKLDDEILDRMLEGIDPGIASKLRELPITYIKRFREMHEVLGPQEAAKELPKLVERRELVLKMTKESAGEGKEGAEDEPKGMEKAPS